MTIANCAEEGRIIDSAFTGVIRLHGFLFREQLEVTKLAELPEQGLRQVPLLPLERLGY